MRITREITKRLAAIFDANEDPPRGIHTPWWKTRVRIQRKSCGNCGHLANELERARAAAEYHKRDAGNEAYFRRQLQFDLAAATGKDAPIVSWAPSAPPS